MRRTARLALAAYPFAHRRRYGEEMQGLLDGSSVSLGVVLDLLRGAAIAHLRASSECPENVDAADRLRLSATGILACWVAFAAAGFVFYRTTDGAAFTAAGDAHSALSGAYLAIQVFAALASAAVLVGAVPLILAALAQRRPGRAAIRRSLAWAIGAIAVFALASAGLVLLAHDVGSWGTAAALAVVAGWGLVGLACAAVCVIAARRGLFAAAVPLGVLRFAASLGILATGAMWAIVFATGVYLVALSGLALSATGNGPGGLISVELSIAAALIAMLGAAALASVSSLRGWRALRAVSA